MRGQLTNARRPATISSVVLARSDFLHGLAACPGCRLPIDAKKDVDELIQPVSETRAVGARVTHRRCGASFEVVFLSKAGSGPAAQYCVRLGEIGLG